MAGSFVEVLTSLSRAPSAINLKTDNGDQTNANIEERVFPDNGGGFHYDENTKLTSNRNISWYIDFLSYK